MRPQRGFTLIELLVALILLGVAALAVISLVTNSGESAGKIASVAAQNSKMRSAMATIQRELSEARSPIINVDTSTCTTGTCGAPSGNSITFIRWDNDASGTRVYLVERIQYNNETTSLGANYRNTLTIQTKRVDDNSPSLSDRVLSSSEAAAEINATGTPRPKIILDKFVKPSSSDPLFQYYRTATAPSSYQAGNLAWYTTIGLVEVNLRRDEDMEPRDTNPAAASANQASPPSRLASSIYLKRIGQQAEGDNDDVSC